LLDLETTWTSILAVGRGYGFSSRFEVQAGGFERGFMFDKHMGTAVPLTGWTPRPGLQLRRRRHYWSIQPHGLNKVRETSLAVGA
jgi:hypothetical protein